MHGSIFRLMAWYIRVVRGSSELVILASQLTEALKEN